VLARHDRNSRTVASHRSSLCATVVASHL
jgi:hypothetical protein